MRYAPVVELATRSDLVFDVSVRVMTEQTTVKPNRIQWIDFARGMGILLVLLGHTSFLPSLPKAYIYSFHMPLFFVISGYVFSRNSTIKAFIIKRVRSLLLPYGSFLAVYIAVFSVRLILANDLTGLKDTVIGLAFQKPGYVYAIWFFIVLFVTEIVFFLIAKCITKIRSWVCVLIIQIAVDVIYFKTVDEFLPFELQICFTALPFFTFGYLLKELRIIERIGGLAVLFGLLFFAASLLLFFIKCKYTVSYTSLTSNKYGSFIVFYSLAVSTILSIFLFSSIIVKIKPVNYLGKNTVVLFALQQPLVSIPINSLAMKLFGGDHLNQFSFLTKTGLSVVELMITIAVLLVVNFMIDHTFLRVFIGKGRRKRSAVGRDIIGWES